MRPVVPVLALFVLLGSAAAIAQEPSAEPRSRAAGTAHGQRPSSSPTLERTAGCLRLKAAGLFKLVNDPAQADLVLELQLTAPNGPSEANKVKGALPIFWLAIYDARGHYVLWALNESIGPALLQKTPDHNFDPHWTSFCLIWNMLRASRR
jgi:hypothetical protein